MKSSHKRLLSLGLSLALLLVLFPIFNAIAADAASGTCTSGHSYETVVTAPTCTEDGITTSTCTVCGDVLTGTIPAIGHSYEIVTNAPTCVADGSTTSTCTVCGDVLTGTIPATGHQFATGVWVTQPTCLAEGQKSYTCNNCGFIKYVTFPTTDHKYENSSCVYCGETEPIASGQCGDNATWRLDANGTMLISGSGSMWNEPPAVDNEFDPWSGTNNGSTYAWCPYRSQIKCIVIQNGITAISANAFRFCYNLSKLTIPESVKTIGDYAFSDCNQLSDVTIPGSVTFIGEEAFSDCSRLKEITFLGSAPSLGYYCFENVTATVHYSCNDSSWTSKINQNYSGNLTWVKHVYSPYELGQSATCIQDATEVSTCFFCGDTQIRILPGTATGHNYKTATTIPATCTNDGCTIQACTICGDAIVSILPATGHNFVDGQCWNCGNVEHIGDVTGDGKINMADVAKVFSHVRNKNKLTDENALLCADVTGDGKINMADVARVFAHVRGKNPLF